jgi:hypothetical protein
MATIHWSVSIQFWSYGDEKAFFTWLESIGGVTRVEGKGTGLVIHLRSKRISQTGLRELLAIYRRYGGDLRELAEFQKPSNKSRGQTAIRRRPAP